MNITPTLLLVLPELFQLLCINTLLLFALLFSSLENDFFFLQKRYNKSGLYKAKWITPALQVEPVTRATILGFICSALLYYNNSLDTGFAFGLIWDDLGRFMSIFLCLSCAAALCLSEKSLKRFSRYEFLLILWLSAIGMLCLIKSYSFLAVYLSIELQSLSFYMLASMRSRNEASAEAGLKYFILSAFSSAMLLLGMALIYGTVGCQSLGDYAVIYNHFVALGHIDITYSAMIVGSGSICMSLLFKLAAAPLHAWIADVYEGTHTSITAWFAICAKIGVITVLIRMCTPGSFVPTTVLVYAAAASLIVGSLSAMRQVKLKRFIAFSAVSNAGWFLLALASGSWQYTVLHLIVYTILSINLFSIFILPLLRTHPNLAYRTRIHSQNTWSEPLRGSQKQETVVDHGADSSTIKYISDLNQIYKVNPGLAFAIAMSMFSLAGIPPLAGFYSKYLIINAVSQSQQYLLLAVSLAVAVISAFYYIRVVKTIYFSTPSQRSLVGTNDDHSTKPFLKAFKTGTFTIQECPTNAYITAITTGLTLVFFIKPEYFTLWLELL